jgi:hypothetical protein
LFRRILRQEAADVLEKLGAEQHDEWDHPVWFPIHHTPAEWAAVLREDRLTHEVRGAFERLAVLLTPLDRAIARVQANSSRKKH